MPGNMETGPQSAAAWCDYCARALSRAGVVFGHGTENARDEAAWMLLHVLDAPLDGSFQDWDQVLDDARQARLRRLLKRRIEERCPLAYLTGKTRFCGLEFFVTRDVLVPRSPVAELILDGFSPWLGEHGAEGLALDMCTGSGCIAIALAAHLPFARVDAADISPAALEIAAKNVALHGLGQRVRLLRSDLFRDLPPERYDLIVSNPPYVAAADLAELPPEYRAEPGLGLASGDDGLDVVLRILAAAPGWLKRNGILVAEVGSSAQALAALLPGVPFLWLEFRHGGEGVFLLEYEALTACQADVNSLLERREHV